MKQQNVVFAECYHLRRISTIWPFCPLPPDRNGRISCKGNILLKRQRSIAISNNIFPSLLYINQAPPLLHAVHSDFWSPVFCKNTILYCIINVQPINQTYKALLVTECGRNQLTLTYSGRDALISYFTEVGLTTRTWAAGWSLTWTASSPSPPTPARYWYKYVLFYFILF
jgi:hypothetical protein